jgi:sulfotransferase family protein
MQHPAVMLPARFHKEVHFFDKNLHHGLSWYRSRFPLQLRAARVSERLGTPVVAGESTPYYMYHPDVPRRIAALLPAVKIIVLLRDPVDRAYSQHAHEMANEFETEPFERALELEPERLAGEAEKLLSDPSYVSFAHQHYSYLARGEYAGQLVELAKWFGRENLLVLESKALFTDPESTYFRVTDFLGVPRFAGADFKRYNERPRAPMPAELRARLEEHFRPHDEELARFLGQPPSWRR